MRGKQQMIADKVEALVMHHRITRKKRRAREARKIWRQETKTTVMTAMAKDHHPCLPLNGVARTFKRKEE
jgi:hypothetical protein